MLLKCIFLKIFIIKKGRFALRASSAKKKLNLKNVEIWKHDYSFDAKGIHYTKNKKKHNYTKLMKS